MQLLLHLVTAFACGQSIYTLCTEFCVVVVCTAAATAVAAASHQPDVAWPCLALHQAH
jgi:hypothetical protein